MLAWALTGAILAASDGDGALERYIPPTEQLFVAGQYQPRLYSDDGLPSFLVEIVGLQGESEVYIGQLAVPRTPAHLSLVATHPLSAHAQQRDSITVSDFSRAVVLLEKGPHGVYLNVGALDRSDPTQGFALPLWVARGDLITKLLLAGQDGVVSEPDCSVFSTASPGTGPRGSHAAAQRALDAPPEASVLVLALETPPENPSRRRVVGCAQSSPARPTTSVIPSSWREKKDGGISLTLADEDSTLRVKDVRVTLLAGSEAPVDDLLGRRWWMEWTGSPDGGRGGASRVMVRHVEGASVESLVADAASHHPPATTAGGDGAASAGQDCTGISIGQARGRIVSRSTQRLLPWFDGRGVYLYASRSGPDDLTVQIYDLAGGEPTALGCLTFARPAGDKVRAVGVDRGGGPVVLDGDWMLRNGVDAPIACTPPPQIGQVVDVRGVRWMPDWEMWAVASEAGVWECGVPTPRLVQAGLRQIIWSDAQIGVSDGVNSWVVGPDRALALESGDRLVPVSPDLADDAGASMAVVRCAGRQAGDECDVLSLNGDVWRLKGPGRVFGLGAEAAVVPPLARPEQFSPIQLDGSGLIYMDSELLRRKTLDVMERARPTAAEGAIDPLAVDNNALCRDGSLYADFDRSGVAWWSIGNWGVADYRVCDASVYVGAIAPRRVADRGPLWQKYLEDTGSGGLARLDVRRAIVCQAHWEGESTGIELVHLMGDGVALRPPPQVHWWNPFPRRGGLDCVTGAGRRSVVPIRHAPYLSPRGALLVILIFGAVITPGIVSIVGLRSRLRLIQRRAQAAAHPCGPPIDDEYWLVGLDRVRAGILERLEGSRDNVLWWGPRRSGKTSLSRLTTQTLEAKGWMVVEVVCPAHDGVESWYDKVLELCRRRFLDRFGHPPNSADLADIAREVAVRSGHPLLIIFDEAQHLFLEYYQQAVSGRGTGAAGDPPYLATRDRLRSAIQTAPGLRVGFAGVYLPQLDRMIRNQGSELLNIIPHQFYLDTHVLTEDQAIELLVRGGTRYNYSFVGEESIELLRHRVRRLGRRSMLVQGMGSIIAASAFRAGADGFWRLLLRRPVAIDAAWLRRLDFDSLEPPRAPDALASACSRCGRDDVQVQAACVSCSWTCALAPLVEPQGEIPRACPACGAGDLERVVTCDGCRTEIRWRVLLPDYSFIDRVWKGSTLHVGWEAEDERD